MSGFDRPFGQTSHLSVAPTFEMLIILKEEFLPVRMFREIPLKMFLVILP